jgi:hypothetical protein
MTAVARADVFQSGSQTSYALAISASGSAISGNRMGPTFSAKAFSASSESVEQPARRMPISSNRSNHASNSRTSFVQPGVSALK